MNAGYLIDFLQTYDRTDEIEVEVHFGEAVKAYTFTLDVTTFSHTEMESGVRNEWSTITGAIGLDMMAEGVLRLTIDHVEGIDRRLSHHGDAS